jgi:hypothetical protein
MVSPESPQVIDSNVSAFTAEADKVVRVGGPEPLIVHTEFLSGRDLAQPEQALWYKLWTATAILIGLRYRREQVGEMMEALLRLGRRKLGPPGAEVEARIAALGDLDRLRELLDRVLDVASWDELLGPPGQSA